jgi:hypothetical protein
MTACRHNYLHRQILIGPLTTNVYDSLLNDYLYRRIFTGTSDYLRTRQLVDIITNTDGYLLGPLTTNLNDSL